MGKQSKTTIGYRYFMGLHMGVCRGPVDELVEIKIGDRTAWLYDPAAAPAPSPEAEVQFGLWTRSGSASTVAATGLAKIVKSFRDEDKITWNQQVTGNTAIKIKAKDLFGGEESEGGVEGNCIVLMGADDQPVDTNLAAMLGGLVPAFRGRFTLFFDGLISAMSKYPKPWAFRVRRGLAGWDGAPWYPEKCIISLDSGKIKARNGAHLLYECLTNRDWGRGFPRARLDEPSFVTAADMLFTESFGLCIRWSRQEKIDQFIQIVQSHIGCNLFLHRVTGLWTLRLVRNDYDVNTLPLFTADTGLLGIDIDDNVATAVAANEIIVTYTRPVDGEEGQVRVQNSAAIRGANGTIPETSDYPGIPTPELALRVAQRDLRAKFAPKKFKVRLDRRGYAIEPGGVFRISAPERGISNLVLRAGSIDDGQLGAGAITVTAVMDIFGLPANSFVAVQSSQWTPPSVYPEPIANSIIGEANHRDLAATLDQATFSTLTPGTNFVTSVAAAPAGLSIDYELATRVGTGNWVSIGADFAPAATLATAIVKTNDRVTVTLANMINVGEVAPGTAAIINGEIFRVDAIDTTDGFCMLARGCVDTVPANHAIGARIYFYQDHIGVDQTEYAAGVTVQTQLLSRTGAGTLSVDSAPIVNHIITQLRDRPYAPGNVQLNSAAYPTKITGALSVSWSHRDRTLQADQLIDQSIGSIGPEVDVSYVVRVTGESGVELVNAETSNTTYTLPTNAEFLSGAVSYAAARDLRMVGIGAVTDPAYFVPAEPNASWDSATMTTGFTLNPLVYQSNFSYDTTTGWVVKTGKTDLFYDLNPVSSLSAPFDRVTYTIRDRRAGAVSKLALGEGGASLAYWASNAGAIRTIVRRREILHRIAKSSLVSGPVTTATTITLDYYSADMAQFDDPTVGLTISNPSQINQYIQNSSGGLWSYANASIAFGSLLYVVGREIASTLSTAGRAVNITNAITAHLNITQSLAGVTRVYSIDASDNIALIATRTGHVLADQVSATTGVEVSESSIKTVNSSTGALGSTIVTFAANIKPTHVVGDPTSSTFYLVVRNTSTVSTLLRRYDLTGTLLAEIAIPNIVAYVNDANSLLLTAGYVYFGFGARFGYVRRINRDLTGLSIFIVGDVTGVPDQVVYGATASYSGVQVNINSPKLLDESVPSTALVPAPTARLNDTLTIELSSKRAGLTSHQKHTITTQRTGWGLRWGESWGG